MGAGGAITFDCGVFPESKGSLPNWIVEIEAGIEWVRSVAY